MSSVPAALVALLSSVYLVCGALRDNGTAYAEKCPHDRYHQYFNGGILFQSECGLRSSDPEEPQWDCDNNSFIMTVCHKDSIRISLIGKWIRPLLFIRKCLLTNGSTSDELIIYEGNGPDFHVSQSNYSNCTFGACFQEISGKIHLWKMTTCTLLQEGIESLRHSTEIPRTMQTSPETLTSNNSQTTAAVATELSSGTSLQKGSGLARHTMEMPTFARTNWEMTNSSTLWTSATMTAGLSPGISSDFKVNLIIVLTSVTLVMSLIILAMGGYIIHLCYLRNKRRIRHRGVLTQDTDVFDVSFKPVAVEFRVAVSESTESIYFSLDQEYEQIGLQTTPFSKRGVPKYENVYSSSTVDNTTDDDGYTVVKEPDCKYSDEGCHKMIQVSKKGLACSSQYSVVDNDDSSGFISAGFDNEDRKNETHINFLKKLPIFESNEHPSKQFYHDSDEISENKLMAEIETEPDRNRKEESFSCDAQSCENGCDVGKNIFKESNDSNNYSDFGIYEDTLSVEDLCLSQDDHFPNESIILSPHYISAPGNLTHLQ